MDIAQYHADVARTAPDGHSQRERLSAAGLGVAAEAGEIANDIKKHLHQGHALDVAALTDEMGDVLYYLAYLGNIVGVTLDDAMAQNVAKRRVRYPDGFSTERSINRTV